MNHTTRFRVWLLVACCTQLLNINNTIRLGACGHLRLGPLCIHVRTGSLQWHLNTRLKMQFLLRDSHRWRRWNKPILKKVLKFIKLPLNSETSLSSTQWRFKPFQLWSQRMTSLSLYTEEDIGIESETCTLYNYNLSVSVSYVDKKGCHLQFLWTSQHVASRYGKEPTAFLLLDLSRDIIMRNHYFVRDVSRTLARLLTQILVLWNYMRKWSGVTRTPRRQNNRKFSESANRTRS